LFDQAPLPPDGSPASAVVNVNFGQLRYVTAVALVKHNLSLSAQARVVLWNSAAMTSAVYDSGWQPVWPRYQNTVSLRWGDSNYLFGRISLDDFGVLPAIWIQVVQPSGSQIVSPFAAQYASIYLSDPTNTAGYLQVGRLYMAEDWTPVRNMAFGASIASVDPSVIDTALDGTEYFELRSKYREVTFSLKAMSVEEGINKAFRLTQNRGVTGDVLFVWDPASPQYSQQRSFVGRLETLNPLGFPSPGLTTMDFKIKELV
jgi:hypothetical protein